ncbi:serine/threonine-protein kinase ATR [Platysternon megacephalum]|uniref:Serine/threonine-protein kinase ATR n=1 Tax=Platysternon megacephalum TaxID=55544 RepID=A0A4D9DY44_9SAUR|nr:serine/threonine-protein kinase ATR [Platysternon megacephalum]
MNVCCDAGCFVFFTQNVTTIKPSHSHAPRTCALNLADIQIYRKCVLGIFLLMEEKGILLHHFSKSIEIIQLWISSPSPFSYQMEHSLLFLSFTYIITNRDVEKEDGGIVFVCFGLSYWADCPGKY